VQDVLKEKKLILMLVISDLQKTTLEVSEFSVSVVHSSGYVIQILLGLIAL